jgi:hypothetical protein
MTAAKTMNPFGPSVMPRSACRYWPTHEPNDQMLLARSGDDYLEMRYRRSAFLGTGFGQKLPYRVDFGKSAPQK